MSLHIGRVPAVYYGQTDWIDSTAIGDINPSAILTCVGRTDVDLEGKFGADNGMRYWRARRRDPEGAWGGPSAWTRWQLYEPGTVHSTEMLYWDDDHPSDDPNGSIPRFSQQHQMVTVIEQREILDELRDGDTGLIAFASRITSYCTECTAPVSFTGLGPHESGCSLAGSSPTKRRDLR